MPSTAWQRSSAIETRALFIASESIAAPGLQRPLVNDLLASASRRLARGAAHGEEYSGHFERNSGPRSRMPDVEAITSLMSVTRRGRGRAPDPAWGRGRCR